jgi:hypothetical protein
MPATSSLNLRNGTSIASHSEKFIETSNAIDAASSFGARRGCRDRGCGGRRLSQEEVWEARIVGLQPSTTVRAGGSV